MISLRRFSAERGDDRTTATGAEAEGTGAQLGSETIDIIGTIQSDASLLIGDLRGHRLRLDGGVGRADVSCVLLGLRITLPTEQPVDHHLQGEAEERPPIHSVDPAAVRSGTPIEASGSAPIAERRAISLGSSVSPIHFAVAGACWTA